MFNMKDVWPLNTTPPNKLPNQFNFLSHAQQFKAQLNISTRNLAEYYQFLKEHLKDYPEFFCQFMRYVVSDSLPTLINKANAENNNALVKLIFEDISVIFCIKTALHQKNLPLFEKLLNENLHLLDEWDRSNLLLYQLDVYNTNRDWLPAEAQKANILKVINAGIDPFYLNKNATPPRNTMTALHYTLNDKDLFPVEVTHRILDQMEVKKRVQKPDPDSDSESHRPDPGDEKRLAEAKHTAEVMRLDQSAIDILNQPDAKGRTFLDYAVTLRDANMVKKLLGLGADPNVKSKKGTGYELISPLSRALGYTYQVFKSYMNSSARAHGPLKDIIVDLVNADANLHEPSPWKDRSLLAYLSLTIPLDDLLGLKEDKRFLLSDTRDLSLDAHRRDQKGIMRYKGYRINLEGLSLGLAAETINRSFENYTYDRFDEVEKLLSEAFKNHPQAMDKSAATIRRIMNSVIKLRQMFDEKSALDLLQHGELVAVPIVTCTKKPGVGDHAQTYLFFKDLCIRINVGANKERDERGNLTYEPAGITIYQIGDMPVFKRDLLKKFLQSASEPLDEETFLLGELITKGKLKKITTVKIPSQTVGNCCMASEFGLLRAIALFDIYRTYIESDKDKRLLDNNGNFREPYWTQARQHSESLIKDFKAFDLARSAKSLKMGRLDKVTFSEGDYFTVAHRTGLQVKHGLSLAISNEEMNCLLYEFKDKIEQEMQKLPDLKTEAEKKEMRLFILGTIIQVNEYYFNNPDNVILEFRTLRDKENFQKQIADINKKYKELGAAKPSEINFRPEKIKVSKIVKQNFNVYLFCLQSKSLARKEGETKLNIEESEIDADSNTIILNFKNKDSAQQFIQEVDRFYENAGDVKEKLESMSLESYAALAKNGPISRDALLAWTDIAPVGPDKTTAGTDKKATADTGKTTIAVDKTTAGSDKNILGPKTTTGADKTSTGADKTTAGTDKSTRSASDSDIKRQGEIKTNLDKTKITDVIKEQQRRASDSSRERTTSFKQASGGQDKTEDKKERKRK